MIQHVTSSATLGLHQLDINAELFVEVWLF